MIRNRIDLSDFDFTFVGHGHYKVTFTSRKTGKTWSRITTNMPLIDATKNCEGIVRRIDLEHLKDICKGRV